jgi:hypothetical protein
MAKKVHYGKCTITHRSPVHKSFNEEKWTQPPCGLEYAPIQTHDKKKVTCIKCIKSLKQEDSK